MIVKISNKLTGEIREQNVQPGQTILIGADERLLVPDAFVRSRKEDEVTLGDPEAPMDAQVTALLGDSAELVLMDQAAYDVVAVGGGSAGSGGKEFSDPRPAAWWLIGGAAGAVTIALIANDDSSRSSGGPAPDETAPDAPLIIGLSQDTGAQGDLITNDATQTLVGTAEPNSTVFVSDGTIVLGNVAADANGNWTFTTPALADGPHSLTATARDTAGNTSGASDAVVITVDTAPPAPGTLAFNNLTPGGEDNRFDLSLNGAEPGATVVYQVSTNNGATWTTTTAAQTNVSAGNYSYRAVVTDTAGNSANSNAISVTINATDDNPPPVIDDNRPPTTAPVTLAAIAEDSGPRLITEAELLANADDPEGGPLSASNLMVTSGNNNGSLVNNGDGTWSYTPAPDDDSAVSFRYIIRDDANPAGTVVGTAMLDITPVNDAPVAIDDSLDAVEDTAVEYTAAQILGNDQDVDGDTLTINSVTSGPGGTAVLNPNGSVTFTPDANVNGPVVFNYTATDGVAISNTASVTVVVSGTDDDATITGNALGTVTEDGTLFATGSLTVTDLDPGEAFFQPQTNTPGIFGSFSIDADGDWTYALNNAADHVQALAAGQTETDTFFATSIDGTTQQVSITVIGSNDAPALTGDLSATVTEGARYILTGTDLGFTDVDDVAAGVSFTVTTPVNGVLQVNGSTATSFTVAQLAAGQVSFLHNGGQSTTASFQVSVEDGNEDNSAPVAQGRSTSRSRQPTTPSPWPTPPTPWRWLSWPMPARKTLNPSPASLWPLTWTWAIRSAPPLATRWSNSTATPSPAASRQH